MLAGNGRRIYAPALILTGLFGFAMQGMSDGVIEFSQTWFWLALVVWVAMNGVLHGMLLPAERAVAAGDETAAKKVDTGGIILTVLLVGMLYLMVFKPGLLIARTGDGRADGTMAAWQHQMVKGRGSARTRGSSRKCTSSSSPIRRR